MISQMSAFGPKRTSRVALHMSAGSDFRRAPMIVGLTQMLKLPLIIALILSANEASAKDSIEAYFWWTKEQLPQLQFSPDSFKQTRVGLVFSDPRRAGEIEKILFAATFKPPKKPLEADFVVEIITKSIKTKKDIGQSASCDWNENKSAAECWIEDDGGAFNITTSSRAADSQSAVLNFVILPNDVLRIAAEKGAKVEVSTTGPAVKSRISFTQTNRN
jgi:hypothetical protein